MEISLNYGTRRYFISDNWFYLLLFIFSFIVFLKQKQKRHKKQKFEKKPNQDRKTLISPLKTRGGGNNSVILQKLYDKCLSDGLYVQVNDSRVKRIIRRMLNIAADKPVIISAPVYLLAILKNKSAPLILQSGGTQLIVSNVRGFISKGVGTILFAKLLAIGSGPLIVASFPLILTALIYSHSHINCNSFVNTLPKIEGSLHSSQYIETIVNDNDDPPIIVAPHTDKLLYHEFDETKVPLFSNLRCYVKDNCLGPKLIQRRTNLKTKRFVPLSERTKTLKDLKCHINEIDEIDVNDVEYKQEN